MSSITSPTISLAPENLTPEVLSGYPWYALRVRSNFERVTSFSLSQRGYEAYLPVYQSRKANAGRKKDSEQPLFPGYVFCRLNANDRLPILTTPGVVHIVRAGENLLPVSESEILAVQRLVKSGLPAGPWPFLKTGQRVLIERGPLTGLEGILAEVKTGYRLVVSIGLLQRSVAAEIDGDWVRPLCSSHSI